MRERLFTAVELAYVAPKADPVPSLAARFAAREAVMKALGVGLGAFGFHDVWVERADVGRAVARRHRGARPTSPRPPASPRGTCRSPTATRSPPPTSSPSSADADSSPDDSTDPRRGTLPTCPG